MAKHGLPLEPRKNWSALERGPTRQDIWDRFVDELDRSGQAGSAADVITPTTLDPNAQRKAFRGSYSRGGQEPCKDRR